MKPSLFPPYPVKHPYYIVSPRYMRVSAGIRVLHLLARVLRQKGYEAYMVSSEVNIYLDTPKMTSDVTHTHYEYGLTPIVIYPEILHGNPLEAPFVVRYLLNHPGLLGGPKNFDPSEYFVSYAKGMNPGAGENERVLFFPASDTSIFYPPPEGSMRSGTCFYAGKYKYTHYGELFAVTKDSFEITRLQPDSPTPPEIAELFRRSELFYCYENSALSLEAMLCGCPVVLLPNPFFTSMIASQEIGNDGLAWGTDPVEIERAKSTVSRVWEHYQKLCDKLSADLDSFITDTQAIAAKTRYRTPLFMHDPYRTHWTRFGKSRRVRLKRLFELGLTGLRSPPGLKGFKSLVVLFATQGFAGLKRKFRERELRFDSKSSHFK